MLATDVLGVIVSRFDTYFDIAAFRDVSAFHRKAVRDFATSLQSSRPIPAKDILAFDRLTTVDAPLVATTFDEAVEAALWILERHFVDIKILQRDKLLFKRGFGVNDVIVLAARNGSRKFVDLCFAKGADDWKSAMNAAAGGGYLEIVKLCALNGAVSADDWEYTMKIAAGGGHRDVIEFCAGNGAKDWNLVMLCAAMHNHRDIFDLCVKKGAEYWDLTIS